MGTPGRPDEVTPEPIWPRPIGTWKVLSAIRHKLAGSTVYGTAQAAFRAQRGTLGTGWCAAAQAPRRRPAGLTSIVVVMAGSSQVRILGGVPTLAAAPGPSITPERVSGPRRGGGAGGRGEPKGGGR